jgi:fructose-bisphosphate aldolase class II
MPLVDMSDMLNHAYRNGYAVGGFDLVSLDFLEAILMAAENCRSPVILSLAESHFEHYDFADRREARGAGQEGPGCDFELAMTATVKAAQRASVPVAIHLDHGASRESAVRAINLGCNGVMVDISHESFPVNVSRTRRVVDMAHACGVVVEGELGYVAGVEGEDAAKHPGENHYTSVEEAKAYVARTGVDCLAVSIGTVHGRLRGKPRLDCERLKRINEAVRIPLVIHGGTGLADEQYRKLISHGVAKINYYTALADAAGNRIRANARADTRAGYTGLIRGIRDVIREEAERVLRLWGSAGRAAEVLVQCRPWRSVHHVIVYNVDHATEAEVMTMMARGREVLSGIPGVRRVVTGWALTEKPKYQFCWLIEFVHENVVAAYRDHPEHLAFAQQLFRPVAGDRISIDFGEVSGMPEVGVTNGAQRARA